MEQPISKERGNNPHPPTRAEIQDINRKILERQIEKYKQEQQQQDD